MVQSDWQPTTSREMLEQRAELLRQIRLFFAQRQVLEVDTPILSSASGTDPNLDPMHVLFDAPGCAEQKGYLQTSPEFAMKRLLAAGSGPIYQLAKSFRNGEAGKRHNPEFTMLEWYRPGFSLDDLMQEVEDLVCGMLNCNSPRRVTYRELFLETLNVDPFHATLAELKALASQSLDIAFDSEHPDHWLDLLFSHCIEPGLQEPVFIHSYPASQAALSQITDDESGNAVARRFELIIAGMELANGYLELTDASEQQRRFAKDLELRASLGLPGVTVDQHFLAALEHGLPDCAGVAVGVDRLLMLKIGALHIRDVISFPVDRV